MALWTPARITTELWLDASDSSTLTLVSGGVSQWNDKSGNARHATQSDASKRPTVSSAAQNGLDVVLFDGSNDTLALPNITQSFGQSVFAVVDTTSIGTDFRNLLNRYAPSSPYPPALYVGGANTGGNAYKPVLFWGTSGQGLVVYPTTLQTAYVVEFRMASDSAGITTDGGTETSVSHSFTALTYWTSICLDIAQQANIKLCELIIANGIDSSTRDKLFGYLNHKWGLASRLPGGHPYKSAAPFYPTPGSIRNAIKFGASSVSLVSAQLTVAPGSITRRPRFGGASVINLLQILQPGGINTRPRFGVSQAIEPSYTGELVLETIVEANDYIGECVLETIIQSTVYTGECVLETVVEPNVYTGACVLETVIESAPYTGVCVLETVIFDRGLLGGDWRPRVSIDGIEIPYDRMTGSGQISAARSVSRVAEFSYVLDAAEAAAFNMLHFHRKPVTIDMVSGSQSIRRFTGQVQAPQWDAKERIVTLHCSDLMEESLIRLDSVNTAALAQALSWSDVIFGEPPATAREYLDQLLELSPVSVQCDAYGLLRAAPLLPIGSIATLTADDIEDGTQSISLADTKQIVNKYEVELTTRAVCCYGAIRQIHYKMGETLEPPIQFNGPAWAWPVRIGGKIMQRSMIEQALDSTGWKLTSDVSYVPPPLSLVYQAPVEQTGINGSTHTAVTDVVFYLKPPEIQNQLAVEFTANLRLEWGQTVEVKDKIVVAWNASIAAYGELTEQARYLADTDFDVQAWEASKRGELQKTAAATAVSWGGRYKDADGTATGGTSVFVKGYGDEPHVGQGVEVRAGKNGLGWGYSSQAIGSIVPWCQTEMLKSHLGNTYSLNLMRIAPGIEIGDGLTPGAGTIVGSQYPLSVSRWTDVWDFDRHHFYTQLETQFIAVGGVATEYPSVPQAFPVPTFAAGYTNLNGETPSEGGGFHSNSPIAGPSPVVYYGESESGEQRMEITLPAIPDQYRETESQDRTGTPLNHGVWWTANNVTIEAPERN